MRGALRFIASLLPFFLNLFRGKKGNDPGGIKAPAKKYKAPPAAPEPRIYPYTNPVFIPRRKKFKGWQRELRRKK